LIPVSMPAIHDHFVLLMVALGPLRRENSPSRADLSIGSFLAQGDPSSKCMRARLRRRSLHTRRFRYELHGRRRRAACACKRLGPPAPKAPAQPLRRSQIAKHLRAPRFKEPRRFVPRVKHRFSHDSDAPYARAIVNRLRIQQRNNERVAVANR